MTSRLDLAPPAGAFNTCRRLDPHPSYRKARPGMSMPQSLCACGRRAKHRGTWCHACYERGRRTGLIQKLTDVDRFLARVKKNEQSGCWVWTGTLTHNGYGQVAASASGRAAHRWSYERFRGPIPDGLELDHLCRNRACVNPDHLEPVTAAENIRRSMEARGVVGVCHRGHRRRAYQHCPDCKRARYRERMADPEWRRARAAYEAERKARRQNRGQG